LNDHLSTKTSSEGDAFTAVVMKPVFLGDRMVIPRGSSVEGSISRILRPGRFKGKAVLNLLFHSITVPGRGQVPIVATLIKVDAAGSEDVHPEGSIEGKSSKRGDAAKVITPGLVGAGIGTLAGGGKGAGIGAGVGVAIGLASVFTSRGEDIEVPKGSTLDIALDRPLTLN
jgi:type IV secretion system protein VirB10